MVIDHWSMVMTIYLLAEMLKNCANGQYHSITIRAPVEAKNVCCEIYFLFTQYYAEQIYASYRQTSDQQNILGIQTDNCNGLPGAWISRGASLMVFCAF